MKQYYKTTSKRDKVYLLACLFPCEMYVTYKPKDLERVHTGTCRTCKLYRERPDRANKPNQKRFCCETTGVKTAPLFHPPQNIIYIKKHYENKISAHNIITLGTRPKYLQVACSFIPLAGIGQLWIYFYHSASHWGSFQIIG